jgi:DNA mismatch repair protein MutL
LEQSAAKEALLEILSGAQGSLVELDGGGLNGTLEEVSESWLHSVACRAAIKAGHSLGKEEMNELIKDMVEAESGGFCPHGRPSSFTITFFELEKKFGRK